MMLTGDQAELLLAIASAKQLPGIPVRYARDRDADARALERYGLIERHYIRTHYGALVTEKGFAVLQAIKSQLSRVLHG